MINNSRHIFEVYISLINSFYLDFADSTVMARNSLSEESLVRFEQYLSSKPYREYSMSKPYYPKASQNSVHSHRPIPQQQQQSSTLAFHELLDNSKNSLTLDRLSYKLRMKSDLNIDTLRETDKRRRRHPRPQPYHSQQNQLNNLEVSDISSSNLPSTTTKTSTQTTMTLSTDAMKTLTNDNLNGIEGNAVRVGTIDDLMKRFRRTEFNLIHGSNEYVDSPSTCVSSNVSKNDRPIISKSQQQRERPIKQSQTLTEYRFKAPTFPSISTRIYREPTNQQRLMYQYKTRERNNTDLPLLYPCPLNSPDPYRQRLNSLIIQDQQPIEISSYDKRIQDSREKSLMRTEKQLCVFNKLTIADPFNSNSDQFETTISPFYQLQPQPPPPPPSINYIFPPVRPFGYFTKKSTTDDVQQSPNTLPFSPRNMKKHGIKKIPHKLPTNGLDSLDRNATIERNDSLEMYDDTIKSTDSLSEFGDKRHNTQADIDRTGMQDSNEKDEL